MTASEVGKALRKVATPQKAQASARFFKTGPGQYGEGDKFLGVNVPEQRKIAKSFKQLHLAEVEKLISSPWHEERLTGLFILVDNYKMAADIDKKHIYDFYLSNTKYINNWDLVDSSAGYIVGGWLEGRSEKMDVLNKLAASKLLWDRRIAMLATFAFIKKGRADEAIAIAEKLLYDKHDLIQKAVGWMLREIGKNVSRQKLTDFLDEYAAVMPRTSLRYAIEHLDAKLRVHYLQAAKRVK